VRELYSFAIQPTVAFYFRVPLEVSLKRILTGRPKLKYYEAGLDIGLHEDPYKSYELFQGRILEEYNKMIGEFDLQVIDATLPLLEQHEIVIETVEGHLEAALRAAQSPWSDVLTSEGLQGRYLAPQASGEKT
jgi:dTMP kinase